MAIKRVFYNFQWNFTCFIDLKLRVISGKFIIDGLYANWFLCRRKVAAKFSYKRDNYAYLESNFI